MVFSMTGVFSWQVLLSFILLHFVLEGQTCLLLQVSLDFLLCHVKSWYLNTHMRETRAWISTKQGLGTGIFIKSPDTSLTE